jgi:NAD(P)H-dependent FMN reductase
MPKLHIIHTSTRPGRLGFPITTWFHGVAQKHGGFEARVVDLAEVNLPLFDEPEHPRFARYQHEHTKRWSAIVDEADAFVFVMAEYNHGFIAAFKNAIDYLVKEWKYKPCAFVGYGGPAGGSRAIQMAKPVVAAMNMMPIYESVLLPMFAQQLDADKKVFTPPEVQEKAALSMLGELARWTDAMRPLRGA